MKQAVHVFLALLIFPMLLSAQQLSGTNYTSSQANATIASAYSYVNTVNESGYLVFQANLTAPYRYLLMASQIYNKSPNTAVFYAQKAQLIAQQQYSSMGYYRQRSFFVIAVIAIAFLVMLIKVMRPVKVRRRAKG
ncbi:MAG: hypothetical protein ACYCO0_02605 [Candidatus Micrarchaeaceae archaeon]